VRLREFLPLGQRVDAFALDAWRNGAWKEFHRGTGIGACRLVRGKMITTTKVRLRIINSPVGPALAEFGLFAEPYRLGPPVIRRDPKGGVTIELRAPVTDIHYTLDGTEPGFNSPAYPGRFPLPNGGTVKARAVSVPEQKLGAVVTAEFEKLAPPAPAPPAK
jgi:alpha-L-fucosidase